VARAAGDQGVSNPGANEHHMKKTLRRWCQSWERKSHRARSAQHLADTEVITGSALMGEGSRHIAWPHRHGMLSSASRAAARVIHGL